MNGTEFFNSSLVQIIIACIIPNIGGWFGAYFTSSAVNNWYKNLVLPSFRPPNWLFGPMWTFLYISMGYASYLVWRDGGGFSGRAKFPLIMFIIQLLLNWAWTPIFFGAHELFWSLVVIIILTICVVITGILFYTVNRLAGLIIIPYFVWLCIATTLNFYIYRDNPPAPELNN